MDFWDVARLMWRRWYVTLPALLLTGAATVWTGLNTEPDYQVTGHVAVVGPSIQRSETDSAVTHVNPWSNEALADAATIRLQGKALADALEAEGYSGEWSAIVTGRLPVIRLEVVAERPEYAQATLQRLREVIDEEVRNRQAEYNVAPEEQITTVPYDGGETVEAVTGKVRRALIVVLGAGLILTTGLVVAYDAIARKRLARAAERAGVSVDQPAAAEPARARYQYAGVTGSAAAANHATNHVANHAANHAGPNHAIPNHVKAVPGKEPPGRTAPAKGAPGRNGPAVPVAGPPNGVRIPAPDSARASYPVRIQYTDQPTSAPISPAPPVAPAPRPEPLPPPDDSTVVLPLSNAGFARRTADDREASSEARTS
jgi:hypothetical protein